MDGDGLHLQLERIQNGSNPAYGTDPSHAASVVGVSEFVVSGGSNILLDSWISYSDLGCGWSRSREYFICLHSALGWLFCFGEWLVSCERVDSKLLISTNIWI